MVIVFGAVMRRYWIDPEQIFESEVRITGDSLHHIRDVCRMGLGSKFEVLSGPVALLVEIVEEKRHESRAKILEKRQIPARPKPDLELVLAMPRPAVFEAVLEKSVELGVAAIHPVFSEFSFVRKDERLFEKKQERWERIIRSATQQSGRGDWMRLEEPMPLVEKLQIINREPSCRGLFAYEGAAGQPLDLALKNMAAAETHEKEVAKVAVFVGSEGGFSEKEVLSFQQLGLSPITLGTQILRVETACVALISILKYHFGQMR